MFDWSDRSSGEEMWRVDAYQIPYYSQGIEEAKQTHPGFADWLYIDYPNLEEFNKETRFVRKKKKKYLCTENQNLNLNTERQTNEPVNRVFDY